MTKLDQAIADAEAAVAALEEAVLEYTMETDRDVHEVGAVFYKLGVLSDGVAFSKKNVSDLLSKLMQVYEILSLEDEGIAIEKSQAKSRNKWDHRTVKSVLSEKIVAAHLDEDGVFDKNIPLSRLIEEAFDYTGLTWKVTKLREVGMNPDQYCEKKDGNISFRVSESVHATNEENDDGDDFI